MKKIMFNDRYNLTRYVISGRKTQTRRIIPDCKGIRLKPFMFEDEHGYELKPKYKLGEIVAVAQSYKDAGVEPKMVLRMPISDRTEILNCQIPYTAGWKNKMFVRADLMPHHIRITNISIERLQDISDEDCIKEGINFWVCRRKKYFGYFDNDKGSFSPHKSYREAYADLIDKINGKGTWESNPFVWVYDFELLKKTSEDMRLCNLQLARLLQDLDYDGDYRFVYVKFPNRTLLMDLPEGEAYPRGVTITPAARLDDAAYFLRRQFHIHICCKYSVSIKRWSAVLQDMKLLYNGRQSSPPVFDDYEDALEDAVKLAIETINRKNNDTARTH